MATKLEGYTIRQCAQDLIRDLERHRGDIEAARELAVAHTQRLLARRDLLELGVRRETAHAGDPQWLYYDHELAIMAGSFERGDVVPVHNHGTWEIVAPYVGEVEYRLYERVDDMSKPGVADLRVVEDGVLKPGSASVCPPPPNDVHGFTAVNHVVLIGVLGGATDRFRKYFDPEANTYVERAERAWRNERTQR